MNKFTLALLGSLLIVSGSAQAEDLVFFQSSVAGADAWSWGGARAKAEGALLVVTEDNAAGGYGDVFPSDRFPYLPSARLTIDVGSIPSGTYTLQVLCFRGSVNFKSLDIVKDSKMTGDQSFTMADLKLPPETQSVMFKLWVANKEGATLKLKELKYYLPLSENAVVVDERFNDPAKWTATDVAVSPLDQGILLNLAPEKTYGNIAWETSFWMDSQSVILFHVAEAQSAVLTLQLDLLNQDDTFIRPADAIKDVGAGWHGAPLSALNLPPEAAKYQIKIWMAGGATSKARIDRFMIVK